MTVLTVGSTYMAEASVPLWAQVASVGLAPIVGLAGVMVGVLLKTGLERSAYLRDERRKVYVSFAHKYGAFASAVCTEGTSAARSGKSSAIRDFREKTRSMASEVEVLRHEIDLIGSRKAASAAGEAYVFIAGAAGLMALALSNECDDGHWNELARFGVASQLAFLNAAQQDLGLPAKDRMAKRDGTDPATREKLLGLLKKIGVEEGNLEFGAATQFGDVAPGSEQDR